LTKKIIPPKEKKSEKKPRKGKKNSEPSRQSARNACKKVSYTNTDEKPQDRGKKDKNLKENSSETSSSFEVDEDTSVSEDDFIDDDISEGELEELEEEEEEVRKKSKSPNKRKRTNSETKTRQTPKKSSNVRNVNEVSKNLEKESAVAVKKPIIYKSVKTSSATVPKSKVIASDDSSSDEEFQKKKKIMFAGISKPELYYEKVILLRGDVVHKVGFCTHLITDKPPDNKSKFKTVSLNWLLDSFQKGVFLDENPYLLG
jgi:hypothetical protein